MGAGVGAGVCSEVLNRDVVSDQVAAVVGGGGEGPRCVEPIVQDKLLLGDKASGKTVGMDKICDDSVLDINGGRTKKRKPRILPAWMRGEGIEQGVGQTGMSEKMGQVCDCGTDLRSGRSYNREVANPIFHEFTEEEIIWFETNILEEDCPVDFEKNKFVLIGYDAIALFPSLMERRCGEIVRTMVEQSDLIFENIEFKQMTLYLKLNKHMTGKLGTLERLLPWRRKVGGVDPGMKNESVRGKKVGGEEYWCWPSATPTKAEEKQIIGRCVK